MVFRYPLSLTHLCPGAQQGEGWKLVRRTLTALVGTPILIGAIWVGFPWLTILVAVVALLGLREFYRMALGPRVPLLLPLGALWTVLFIVSGQLADQWYDYTSHVLLGIGIMAALIWLVLNRNRAGVFAVWAYAVGGPIYVGFLLAHALMLREMDGGADSSRDWVLFALLVTFATDTGAFFTGRAIGRHKMAPSISPNKTWEGAIGGFLWAVGAALALGAILQLSVPLWQRALIGTVIGVMAQWGDLAESRLKRATGAKDAGSILPGHGGILDRLDSIVFTFPVVYYLVALVLKPSG